MASGIQSSFRIEGVFHFLHQIVFGIRQSKRSDPAAHSERRLLDYSPIFSTNLPNLFGTGNLHQNNSVQRVGDPGGGPVLLYYFTYGRRKSYHAHDEGSQLA